METTVVIVMSHRARAKLYRLLPDQQHGGHFSLFRDGDFYFIPNDRLAEVLAIKSIRKSKPGPDLHRRWSLMTTTK